MSSAYELGLQDYNWAIGLNRVSLRLMGAWPEFDDAKRKSFKNILRMPFMMLSMFCFAFMPQVYALTFVSHDLTLVIDNFMSSCPAFTCCIKLFFLWHNRNELKPVVYSLSEDWLRVKQDWEREIMKNEAALAKSFTIGGYIFIMCTYLGYIVPPFFNLEIRLLNNITDYAKRHLIAIQSYYPYDYSDSPIFELTFMSQIMSTLMIQMALAIPDNYFGALVFHLSGQFKILGVNIEHFISEDNNVLRNMRKRVFTRTLGIYVNRHVHLIRMVTAVEKSFTFLILSQLFIMCVTICSFGFRITYAYANPDANMSVVQSITLVTALITLSLFTFANCTASESLASHSTHLLNNIYNCNWYLVPEHSTRDLIIMMNMSKNLLPLTAGKIFYLSMANFCSIIKTIAGYISVLTAVSN